MPSTGTLRSYVIPAGPGVRVDSGVVAGSEIPIYYDPMIAKLITWGRDRSEAIGRMRRALEEFRISGVETTIAFHRVIMDNPKFMSGEISTRFLPDEYPDNVYRQISESMRERAAMAIALDKYLGERQISVEASSGSGSGQSNWRQFYRRKNLRSFGGSR